MFSEDLMPLQGSCPCLTEVWRVHKKDPSGWACRTTQITVLTSALLDPKNGTHPLHENLPLPHLTLFLGAGYLPWQDLVRMFLLRGHLFEAAVRIVTCSSSQIQKASGWGSFDTHVLGSEFTFASKSRCVQGLADLESA